MKEFDRSSITSHGRAVFYAAIYPELIEKAYECGWALALHGSLASDMDIMAMPWTETATSANELIYKIQECFNGAPFLPVRDEISKPNNRVVYTIPIWSDFYLDINVIENKL